MIGANRHELPIIGNSFGPGTSENGFIFESLLSDTLLLSGIISRSISICGLFRVPGNSFGKIFMADENVVRFTSALAAARELIFQFLLRKGKQIKKITLKY